MSIDTFISPKKIYKINVDNDNINFIKQEYILLKHTAEGTNFTKINKKKINNKSNFYKKQLYNLFTKFENPMYEVLLNDSPTKIYLDCDFSNLELLQFTEKDNIIIKLNNYLISFLKSKNICTDNIIYSDASRKKNNKYKISVHIVLNNVYLKNRKILKELIKDFKSHLSHDSLYYNAIDTSVYNQPQLFKCVLSPSKDDNTLLLPFNIKNNVIIKYDNEYIIDNILDFLVGCYITTDNFIDNTLNYTQITENSKKITENTYIIKGNQKKWILNNNYIKNIYVLRSNYVKNDKIDLIRKNSSYCKLCNRVHENENGFCKIYENSIYFYCGRNKKGICIGYWNTNYESYDKKDTNKELYDIIDNLKIYITDIEEKYNNLNKEFNVLKDIHNNCIEKKNENKKNITKNNKKYTKDINSEMWMKYYELGRCINEGFSNVVDNIIKSWRDGSIGRLKKRGLLIYEYINYIRENNLENKLSMRRIFHKKNYETFSSLL
jgi:hypothetical protein